MTAPEREGGVLADSPGFDSPRFDSPGYDAPSGVLFVDDGIVWHVCERCTARDPGARAAHCLLFMAEGLVRRVWRYPTDWNTLPTAKLADLCRQPY